MTLRKITIDNSVTYVNKDSHMQSEQTPHISEEREIRNQTPESELLPTMNFHKRMKKSFKK